MAQYLKTFLAIYITFAIYIETTQTHCSEAILLRRSMAESGVGQKPLRELISGTESQQSSYGRVPLSPERIQAENTVREMSLDRYIQAARDAFDLDGRYHGTLMDHLRSRIPFIGRNDMIQGNWLDHLVWFTLEKFPSGVQISGVRLGARLDSQQFERVTQKFLSMILNV
ncbi:hypothetical protein PGT21_023968 [Puccinia graminis f. sp. tritici]|uniref:Uncharacterized protein n=1 Tax=Puccinia graminis f. sp. tritici TaxID=56615 RepID=A0A5B0MPH7_PUCGR|nr:hypothetical protein PGT21_023968 [Puccinia graminis f. sp. tritici]